MAELDTIVLTNPTKADFTVRFNGEPYSIAAGAQKSFPQFLGFHIAKHLSDSMLAEAVVKLKKENSENPYKPEVGQLLVYDNPKRRIALYQILGSKELVESCMNSYPFKGFIGIMQDYDDYVAKVEAKGEKVTVSEEETPAAK